MPYSAEGNWQAADIFDVIRRLVDDSIMTDAEKTMAHALVDAHGSQYVRNTELFHAQLGIHGQILGVPPGSPQWKAAVGEQLAP